MNSAVTSWAPPGVRCKRCLCCDAVIVFAGEALCAACDDGTHPPLPEKQRISSFEEDAAAVGAALGATDITIHTLPIEEEPMKVSPEIRQKILDAPLAENHVSVDQRLGLTPGTAWYYRKGAGAHKNATGTKPAKPSRAKDLRPDEDLAVSRKAPATFIFTDNIVNDWWMSLPLGKKAEIFAGNYVIQVKGTIS